MATTRILVLVVLLVGTWAATPAVAGRIESACKTVRHMAVNACKPVLYGTDPSPQCCELVRVTPWQCICPIVTRKLAPLIDVNRAVRFVEGCGRRVPRHFKCGSITT